MGRSSPGRFFPGMKPSLLACLCVLGLLTGCRASWTSLRYESNPIAVGVPAEDLERLLMTGRDWRPLKVEIKPKYLTAYYPTQYGMSAAVVTFAEISKIELLFAPKWEQYDVEAQKADGTPVIRYTAPSKEAAQEFIDVLTALTHPK